MKKNITIKYYNELLKANCVLFVGDKESLWKKYKISDNNDWLEDADGSVFKIQNDVTEEIIRIIWIKDFKKGSVYWTGVLAHEITHLILGIMEDKGMPINIENQELIAYSQEHFFTYFYEKLIKNRTNKR